MSLEFNLVVGRSHRRGMGCIKLSGSSRVRVQQVPEGEEETRHMGSGWGGVAVFVEVRGRKRF